MGVFEGCFGKSGCKRVVFCGDFCGGSVVGTWFLDGVFSELKIFLSGKIFLWKTWPDVRVCHMNPDKLTRREALMGIAAASPLVRADQLSVDGAQAPSRREYR
jgi:hypothetical protein